MSAVRKGHFVDTSHSMQVYSYSAVSRRKIRGLVNFVHIAEVSSLNPNISSATLLFR